MISVTESTQRTLIRVEGDGDVNDRAQSGADEFQVILKENGSTGYVWTLESTEATMIKDERFGGDPKRVGGAQDRAFLFTTPAPGTSASVKLVLSRPWDDKSAPVRTVLISVLGTSQK